MDGAKTPGSCIVWKDGMPRSQKSQENNNGHSRSGINALPTVDGDGDPLDVLLIGEEPAPVGCVVLGKIVGVLEGKQTEKGRNERNDRIIAIPIDGKSRKPMMPAP